MNDPQKANDQFTDPLEDFEPKTYDDSLERALAEEDVAKIQHQPVATIHPDASVDVAVGKLAKEHVGCLLVEEDEKLVGVFGDRDVLDKVALEGNYGERRVRDVMTTNPVFVYADDPAGAALSVMAVSGYRHVPIVDTDLRILGIISPQRVTGFLSANIESDQTGP